jgi:Calcineurin-like phosphoesterase
MAIRPTDVIVSFRGIRDVVRAGLDAPVAESADEGYAETLGEVEDALDELQRADHHHGVMAAPESETASLLLSSMAEQASERADALAKDGKLVPVSDAGYEVKYDEKDLLGWTASFFSWRERILGKHEWIPAPVEPTAIGNEVRIAILGDWGSGRYGAPECARSIDASSPAYDVILHLGDVYYAGTDGEVEDNFLALWPKTPKLSRACNSNHEMYTGGRAYFHRTLSRFQQPGGSSNFALANDHWLLVGMDTAYVEHDVEPAQLEWLKKVLGQADGRQVVLFSHHQPFSGLENAGRKLSERLLPLFRPGSVFAWYWGHEHRCVLYEKHPTWGLGRCAGHSGFPYFREVERQLPGVQKNPDGTEWRAVAAGATPKGLVLDGANAYVKEHEGDYGPNGYLSLLLSDTKLDERVHAADGTLLYEKEL